MVTDLERVGMLSSLGEFSTYIPFSMKKMLEALSYSSYTASGEGYIIYEVVKHLPYETKVLLLDL